MDFQAAAAFTIVAAAFLWAGSRLFQAWLAAPLSRFLLKRKKVKWAMRVRGMARGRSCC